MYEHFPLWSRQKVIFRDVVPNMGHTPHWEAIWFFKEAIRKWFINSELMSKIEKGSIKIIILFMILGFLLCFETLYVVFRII